MGKRIYPPVNSEILVWARQSVNYDLIGAARKIGVSTDRLADFEKGCARPTTKQLLKISKVYDCPFAAFFFEKPPNQLKYELGSLGDWRKLPSRSRSKLSPNLTLELRLALRRRDILLEISEDSGVEIARFSIEEPSNSRKETAANLAKRVREHLGVSLSQQMRFRDVYTALRIWRNAIEQLEVIVSQTGFSSSVEPDEMRGVAISFDVCPMILINIKDPPTARIFTLMHELGHLILREGGISNDYSSFVTDSNEVFCNEFAGELLVPKKALLSELVVLANCRKSWEDDDLEKLARRYRVGKEVILRRLLVHGKTTGHHYSMKVAKWKRDWEDLQKNAPKIRRGARPHHERFVRHHGLRYVSTVLGAYGQNLIHSGQLSEYLGAKQRYIPGIVSDVARVSA